MIGQCWDHPGPLSHKNLGHLLPKTALPKTAHPKDRPPQGPPLSQDPLHRTAFPKTLPQTALHRTALRRTAQNVALFFPSIFILSSEPWTCCARNCTESKGDVAGSDSECACH